MKLVLLLVAVIVGSMNLAAQDLGPSVSLSSVVAGLNNGTVSVEEFVHQMVSVAPLSTPHSVSAFTDFASRLRQGIKGKAVTGRQLEGLASCIMDTLRGAHSNFSSTYQMRQILRSVGFDAGQMRDIAAAFLAVGEEINGPDDTFVRRLRLK